MARSAQWTMRGSWAEMLPPLTFAPLPPGPQRDEAHLGLVCASGQSGTSSYTGTKWRLRGFSEWEQLWGHVLSFQFSPKLHMPLLAPTETG